MSGAQSSPHIGFSKEHNGSSMVQNCNPTAQYQCATSSDAIQVIVNSLMYYCQGDVNEAFARSAIEALVRKLKDKQDELDALITAVTSNGARPTKCVTLPRTLDGRLQVAGRKGLPHVMFSRIWRWPHLLSMELKHLHGVCQYGFDLRLDSVCINPYHYERVVDPAFAALSSTSLEKLRSGGLGDDEEEVPDDESEENAMKRHPNAIGNNSAGGTPARSGSFKTTFGSPSGGTNSFLQNTQHYRVQQPVHSSTASPHIPSDSQHPQPLNKSLSASLISSSHNSQVMSSMIPASLSTYNMQQHFANSQGFPSASHYLSGGGTAGPPLASLNHTSGYLPGYSAPANPTTGMSVSHSVPAIYGSNSSAVGGQGSGYLPPHLSVAVGQGYNTGASMNSSATPFWPNNPLSIPSSAWGLVHGGAPTQSNPVASFPHGSTPVTQNSLLHQPSPTGSDVNAVTLAMFQAQQQHKKFLLSSQRIPEYWCTIGYFELDQQVGESFKVPSQFDKVIVDGYTDPSSPNRFCLGQLSNVHRSDQSEKSRLYIGQGIELQHVGDGDVWIRCLSKCSIFVQSYFLDREVGRQPGEVVHKIYPGATIKVFHMRQCCEDMYNLSRGTQENIMRQAFAMAGATPMLGSSPPNTSGSLPGGHADVGVDDLRRLCILRLSFVKGWGPDYPRRSIKETPCWIEIQLHRPLQLLDEVLQSMSVSSLRPSRQFFSNLPYAQA